MDFELYYANGETLLAGGPPNAQRIGAMARIVHRQLSLRQRRSDISQTAAASLSAVKCE